MLHRSRVRTLMAALLAASLALGAAPLLGVSPASAAELPPPADPVASGAFCDGAPSDNPFSDLGSESASTRSVILCLVATALTSGTSPTTFTPGGSVTRRQMALFVKRLADLLDDLESGSVALAPLPEYDGSPDFSDVSANDAGAEAIGQLAQAEIISGFPDGTFRPNEPVSRRGMAAFVNNLQEFLTGARYTAEDDYFTDDDGDSREGDFNGLAGAGIFQGDGQGRVFPAAPITRRQMANILLRDAQVFFEAEVIETPFKPLNAAFRFSPTDAASLEVATEPAITDDRAYRVIDLNDETTYTIQLFPAANVRGTTTISFVEDGDTGTADEGTVAADITKVNGSTPAAPGAQATIEPVDGQVTFIVDGSALETIVPVLFLDADADGDLDIDADGEPVAAELFGIGGKIRYLPAEAAIGSSGITVTAVTQERDAFVSGGRTYYFDSNDTYQYQGVAISRAQFDSMLSVGDVGSASYNPSSAGVSVFNITTDDVDAPAKPSVAVVDGDAGGTINDARVTYTRPATNSPGVAYSLHRAPVDDGADDTCATADDTVGAFAPVTGATQAAGTGDGVFVFSNNNVADGCYAYRVRATSPISSTTADSAGSDSTAVPGPEDTTAPTSTYAKRTTDVGLSAFDAGDVIKVVFSEPMAVPPAGATIRVSDGDLTFADIVDGTNATFTLNSSAEVVNGVSRGVGTVITITLTGNPTTVFPGVSPGVQAPATVEDRSGIADLAGNGWDLAGSADTSID
ncbi:MAG TPA: S-layer homology domain-containing protein [Nitriliruptorales bacterium]